MIADIETPAFGYEKKLIIVKNSGLFKREVKKKGAAFINQKEQIIDYIKNNVNLIESAICLIFIEEDADKSDKLTKLIEENGVVCNFERQKPVQIAKKLKQITNAYKVNVDENTLMYLIECVGLNMQDLINEIRKLIEYCGEGGRITKELIDILTIKQIESVIFDLTDNLGQKNIACAMQVLNNLIYQKEPLQKILITLYNHFKKLYLVNLSQKYNRNLAESLDLKPNQMFLTTKYRKQAGYFKENELRKILQELTDLDANSKIGLIDLKIGLESILCTYCS